jgi:beta-glucanase (GH16 family)
MSTRTLPLVSVLVVQALTLSLRSAYADWQLVWAGEFDGPGIDATRWTFDLGNGTGGWGNNELEYYTSRPQNLSGPWNDVSGARQFYRVRLE